MCQVRVFSSWTQLFRNYHYALLKVFEGRNTSRQLDYQFELNSRATRLQLPKQMRVDLSYTENIFPLSPTVPRWARHPEQ